MTANVSLPSDLEGFVSLPFHAQAVGQGSGQEMHSNIILEWQIQYLTSEASVTSLSVIIDTEI